MPQRGATPVGGLSSSTAYNPRPVTTLDRSSSSDIFPTARQAAVTFLGGLALAAGTCAGFWATFDLTVTSPAFVVMLVAFLASLAAAAVGAVLVLVREVRLRLRRDVGTPPAADSPAWQPFASAVGLGALTVGAFLSLGATDDSLLAPVSLAAAALCAIASLGFFAVALVRFLRTRRP
jgi:hypothetical protein